MICPNCNKKLAADVRFCKYCGAEVAAIYAVPPSVSHVENDEEETVLGDTGPEVQGAHSEPSYGNDYPAKTVAPLPKKKKHTALWIILPLLFVLLSGAAAYLVYNDNYKAVLSAVGFPQDNEPEADPGWTEPIMTVPTQTTESPTDSWEFVFPEEETQPSTIPTTKPSTVPTPSIVTGIQERYKVVTAGNDLRIRNGPGTEFDQIGRISKGTIVTVTQKHNNGESQYDNWGHIEYKGIAGWVAMDFLQPIT